jgi:hypothetical protein
LSHLKRQEKRKEENRKEKKKKPFFVSGVAVCTYSPSTWGAEAGGSIEVRSSEPGGETVIPQLLRKNKEVLW